ncbi:siphovirus Gp157 family protein [Trichloromonas sp.]|uniref:siphovirus Gp157 family protein n=1 Tax=Trichloromonas sp. TaxID=3069249 RepID=UPI002A3D1AC9|nr:siphovirus Gp157 family protein [Trichloromonas sp.]
MNSVDLIDRPLYRIADELCQVLNGPDEWDDDTLAKLDGLTLQLSRKADDIAALITHFEQRAEQCDAEIKRLSDWKRSVEGRAAWLRNYLESALRAAGRDSLETSRFRLKIQKNPPAAVATDESATPPRFVLTIPESHRPDKKAILQALKEGELVPGWRLSQAERLVIR